MSEDFDFFSSKPFVPMDLLAMIPFLSGGVLVQSAPNTVTLILRRKEPVKISFVGGLTFGRVGQPARARENEMAVASRLDLAATKAKVVAERAESKDYLDIFPLPTFLTGPTEAVSRKEFFHAKTPRRQDAKEDRFNPQPIAFFPLFAALRLCVR